MVFQPLICAPLPCVQGRREKLVVHWSIGCATVQLPVTVYWNCSCSSSRHAKLAISTYLG